MIKNKGLKFRIYPTQKQIDVFNENIKCSNFIYNYFLRETIDLRTNLIECFGLCGISMTNQEWSGYYKKHHTKENPLWFDNYHSSKIVRTSSFKEKYPWIDNISNSSTIDLVLQNLKRAFENMKKTNAGFPNFKSSKDNNKSYSADVKKSYKLTIEHIKHKRYNIRLPGNDNTLSDIECIIHRDIFNVGDDVKIKGYTISTNPNKQWFITFKINYIDDTPEPKLNLNNTLSYDLGVKRAKIVSSSDEINNKLEHYNENFNFLKDDIFELKRLQRLLSHKQELNGKKNPYTRNMEKLKQKINRLHLKVANKRKWNNDNISKIIAESEHDVIIGEDLNIKGMTKKSAKGKSNNKKGLTRSILNAGWGQLNTMISYKTNDRQKKFVQINPKNTSRRCVCCGSISKDNRLTQSEFICVNTKCDEYGVVKDADKNATQNITEKYFGVW